MTASKRILLVATLDTKVEEAAFVARAIRGRGYDVELVDVSLGAPGVDSSVVVERPAISRADIASAAGSTVDAVVALPRAEAMRAVARGRPGSSRAGSRTVGRRDRDWRGHRHVARQRHLLRAAARVPKADRLDPDRPRRGVRRRSPDERGRHRRPEPPAPARACERRCRHLRDGRRTVEVDARRTRARPSR